MSVPVFPTLPGLGWSVKKTPVWSTRRAGHVSGREVRAANFANPLWRFELTYEVLRADSLHNELQTLMGFYLTQRGSYGAFLFQDQSDNQVTGQVIGTGDGITTQFQLVRSLGGFVEPVGGVTGGVQIQFNGANQAAGWSLVAPNIIQFASPPAPGIRISASFPFYYLCRFDGDEQEYENFMSQLWSLQSCKLISVRS